MLILGAKNSHFTKWCTIMISAVRLDVGLWASHAVKSVPFSTKRFTWKPCRARAFSQKRKTFRTAYIVFAHVAVGAIYNDSKYPP